MLVLKLTSAWAVKYVYLLILNSCNYARIPIIGGSGISDLRNFKSISAMSRRNDARKTNLHLHFLDIFGLNTTLNLFLLNNVECYLLYGCITDFCSISYLYSSHVTTDSLPVFNTNW